MISFDYSPKVISPNFKGAKNLQSDEIIRKSIAKIRKDLTKLEVTESKFKDPFVSPSEKLEAADSVFSKWLAKIFRFFNL